MLGETMEKDGKSMETKALELLGRNLFGSTALICAAANGYAGTMEELLRDERVDLEVATRLGQTALFKAMPLKSGFSSRTSIPKVTVFELQPHVFKFSFFFPHIFF